MTTYNDANWTHVYPSAGTYTVKIYGKFVGIVFNNAGDKLKLLSITKWGPDFRIGTTQGLYFYGCSNLVVLATDVMNTDGCTSLSQAFRNCSALTDIPRINFWDVSKIITLDGTFISCILYNGDMSAWNTISATDLTNFLNGCSSFTGDLGAWNVSNVTLMTTMFFLTKINSSLNNWDVSKVTNMANLFFYCPFYNQPMNLWNTGNVTNMTSMFSSATAFNQDISTFNISKLASATNMLLNSGFSLNQYDKLLNATTGWPSQATVLSNVSFHAGTAHYSAGLPTTGRAFLTVTKTWTITDGGTP